MTFDVVFDEIILKNFMSYGNAETVIPLNVPGTTHIRGINRDTGSENGVGKSTIMNALCFVLYGKVLAKIKNSSIPNLKNGSKGSCEVTLRFSKGGDIYQITRKTGKSSGIDIRKNNSDQSIARSSIAEANKQIVELVGISFELYKRTVIFSGKQPSYFEEPASVQKAVSEELLRLLQLSEKGDILKEQIKETKSDLNIESKVVEEKKSLCKKLQTMLENEKMKLAQWDKSHSEKLQSLLNEIESGNTEEINFDEQKEAIEKYNAKYNEFEEWFKNVQNAESEIKTLVSNKTKLEKENESLANSICPYCKQEYAEGKKKIEQNEEMITEIISKIEPKEAFVKEFHDSYQTTIDELQQLKEELTFSSINQLFEAQNKTENLENKLESLRDQTNPHITVVEEIEKNVADMSIDESRINALTKKLEHEQFLLKLLTNKNSFIRKKLIARNLPILNERLSYYTKSLGLAYTVAFNPDLSPCIMHHGLEYEYGNLSGGESKRLDLALSMAFRDVRQIVHAKVNLLFTDEIDGGSLDNKGVVDILNTLYVNTKDGHTSIFVISHRPEILGSLDQELLLVLENGFTSVEEG